MQLVGRALPEIQTCLRASQILIPRHPTNCEQFLPGNAVTGRKRDISQFIYIAVEFCLTSLQYAWSGRFPWSRERLATPVYLPGESHGQKSLVGYSPWGRKESGMTEQLTLSLHFHFFLMRDGSTLMALHSVSLGKKKVRRESRLKDGKNITNGIVKHTYSEKVFSLCHWKFELSIKIP